MNKTILLLLGASLAAVLCSCGKNGEPDSVAARKEYIKVYETSPDKTVNDIQVPFEGVQGGEIHVLSNVDLQWKHLVDPDETGADWFTIKSVDVVEPGHTVVTYDAASILPFNLLNRRESKLSFSCPESSIGKFITIRQGYSHYSTEDFSDEPGEVLTLTGNQTYTTREYQEVALDYYDYISFNAWAETSNEFLSKNITLDISISGGKFFATGLTTYRINVPVGTAADKSNLKYLLLVGDGEHMSPKTTFTFSVANDDMVFIHIDNFSIYQVTEAEMGLIVGDEDFDEIEEEIDWV
jgi:hypothetical protein